MKPALVVACILLAACFGLVGLRLHHASVADPEGRPQAYRLSLRTGGAEGSALLPIAGDHQSLHAESIDSVGLRLAITDSPGRRELRWTANSATERQSLAYTVEVTPSPAIRVPLPRIGGRLMVSSSGPEAAGDLMRDYFEASRSVTGASPTQALLRALSDDGFVVRSCRGIDVGNGDPVAVSWVETLLGGVWVPFDPERGHFAARPANRITLSHDPPDRQPAQPPQPGFEVTAALGDAGKAPFTADSLEPHFARAGISRSALEALLLLPVACLVVLVARSVVGVESLGTFMPALVAISFHGTGLAWGLLLLLIALAGGTIVRLLLEPLHLLHTARLAVILVSIVGLMLAATWLSSRTGLTAPAQMVLFPIAIITMDTERTFHLAQLRGIADTARVLVSTLLVVIACYAVMHSPPVMYLIFEFPEILIGVIALCITLGRYTGLRLLELRRFRSLLPARP